MFDSSKLDAYLTGLCQARDLPGVSAAIMGPDGLEYAFNYGFRDGAFTRPVDNDTLFGVASMSKSMTALCACILACEGRPVRCWKIIPDKQDPAGGGDGDGGRQ